MEKIRIEFKGKQAEFTDPEQMAVVYELADTVDKLLRAGLAWRGLMPPAMAMTMRKPQKPQVQAPQEVIK
jgi:hypothetical protein